MPAVTNYAPANGSAHLWTTFLSHQVQAGILVSLLVVRGQAVHLPNRLLGVGGGKGDVVRGVPVLGEDNQVEAFLLHQPVEGPNDLVPCWNCQGTTRHEAQLRVYNYQCPADWVIMAFCTMCGRAGGVRMPVDRRAPGHDDDAEKQACLCSCA
jgi:hypothetical protein